MYCGNENNIHIFSTVWSARLYVRILVEKRIYLVYHKLTVTDKKKGVIYKDLSNSSAMTNHLLIGHGWTVTMLVIKIGTKVDFFVNLYYDSLNC